MFLTRYIIGFLVINTLEGNEQTTFDFWLPNMYPSKVWTQTAFSIACGVVRPTKIYSCSENNPPGCSAGLFMLNRVV